MGLSLQSDLVDELVNHYDPASPDPYVQRLTRLVEKTGRVQLAGAETSPLRALEQMPEVDVLFLDIEMPGLSGLETVTLARRVDPALMILMVFDKL